MALRARRAIGELRRGRDELARQVATFTDDDLARQSECADWDVSQVLSHLGSAAEMGRATLEAAVAGQDPPGREANQPIWDRWNAMSTVERSVEWAEWTERNQSAFESLDDATLSALRVNFSFFPAPVDAVALAGMRLSEQALHHWDVASSFDGEATIPQSAAELLIDRMPGMMRWAGHADRWSGGPGRISITTTAPERTWTLRIADAVDIDEAQSDEPIGLTLPAETFIRMVAGRLRDADASRIHVHGPATIADVGAMFPWVLTTSEPVALTALLDMGRGDRKLVLDCLVIACDVYTWKLLRRDAARSRKEAEASVRLLVGRILEVG